jgi:hypothetical protein
MLGVGMLVVGVVGLGATAVSALPAPKYLTWSLAGTGGAYTATAGEEPIAFPQVSVTSTSGGPASVGSGASTWIPAGTPFGTRFGSSQDRPYLSLRPAADRTDAPSVTTFTFASPTPVGSWALALGDIDAEALEVRGTDADGGPLTGAQVGLVEVFNYCNASPRSSACGGQSEPYPLPTTAVAGDRVTLEETGCPVDPTRCDTTGASAWVSPTVPIRTLTVTSTWRQGSPSYQAWLAVERRELSGAVEPAVPPTCGTEVPETTTLLTTDGRYIAEESGSDGGVFNFSYIVPGRYVVRISLPDTWELVDPGDAERVIDVRERDATGLVSLARPLVGNVTVDVHDPYGPVPGAEVRLVRGQEILGPATADENGFARLTRVPVGTWTIEVLRPGATRPITQRLDLRCGFASVDVRVPLAPSPTSTTPAPSPSDEPAPPTPGTTTGAAADRPSGELAATGLDPTPPLAVASTLLLLGTGLVGWSRRRPHRTH